MGVAVNPARQRLEGLLLGRLGRGGKRRQGAAVEALGQRDDEARGQLGVFAGGLRAATGVQARQLDGALVGLGAGVREEGLPRLGARLIDVGVQHVRQQLGHFPAVLDVVVVAHVDELGRLIAHGLHDGGVAVAEAADADAGEEVEVLVAGIVDERHAVAFDEFHGLAGEGAHHVFGFQGHFAGESHGMLLTVFDELGGEFADRGDVQELGGGEAAHHGAHAGVGEHLQQQARGAPCR